MRNDASLSDLLYIYKRLTNRPWIKRRSTNKTSAGRREYEILKMHVDLVSLFKINLFFRFAVSVCYLHALNTPESSKLTYSFHFLWYSVMFFVDQRERFETFLQRKNDNWTNWTWVFSVINLGSDNRGCHLCVLTVKPCEVSCCALWIKRVSITSWQTI